MHNQLPARGPKPPNPGDKDRTKGKSKPERPIAMSHRPREKKKGPYTGGAKR